MKLWSIRNDLTSGHAPDLCELLHNSSLRYGMGKPMPKEEGNHLHWILKVNRRNPNDQAFSVSGLGDHILLSNSFIYEAEHIVLILPATCTINTCRGRGQCISLANEEDVEIAKLVTPPYV